MKKPKIGVVPLYDEKKSSIWMLPGYMNAVSAAGGIPLILPYDLTKEDFDQIRELYDGFLFTGGADVDPVLYNEKRLPSCGISDPVRDRAETMIFDYAYEKDIPVLGICRGCQIINVLLGGTLYQDLLSQRPATMNHHMTPPYDRTVHDVLLPEHTILSDLWGKTEKPVNSYHHQAIRRVADDLSVIAVSEDGLTEGVCCPDKRYLLAVQWHPEFIFEKDPDQMLLMKSFIRAANGT